MHPLFPYTWLDCAIRVEYAVGCFTGQQSILSTPRGTQWALYDGAQQCFVLSISAVHKQHLSLSSLTQLLSQLSGDSIISFRPLHNFYVGDLPSTWSVHCVKYATNRTVLSTCLVQELRFGPSCLFRRNGSTHHSASATVSGQLAASIFGWVNKRSRQVWASGARNDWAIFREKF